MKKHLLLKILIGAVFITFCVGASAQRWNLLIITADDLNGDSMGWMGSKVGATPNIDLFSKSSHQFRNCHVTVPICQPSREALMTGRVPHRNGGLGFNPINLDVPTLVEVMSSNGYFTAAINKTGHMQPRQKFDWDMAREGSGKNPSLFRAQFEECIKAAAAARKPFFINANSTDPHRPFVGSEREGRRADVPDKAPNKTRNEAESTSVKQFSTNEVVVPSMLEDIPEIRKEIAQYFSSVRRLDQTFGEIIAALKAAGQFEKTVIVFLSDHGISAPYSKATLFRNGTWTPLLLRLPGMGKPVISEDFVSSVDIMPTVLELLKISQPAGMDGRSWVPLLRGEKQPARDHVFTHVNSVSSGKNFPGRCIRTKTRSYIWNAWPNGKTEYRVEAMGGLTWNALFKAAERDPKIKSRVDHFLYRCPEEFYDLEKDPDERTNLINDPAYRDEMQHLKRLLRAHMERTDDPLLSQFLLVGNTARVNPHKTIEPNEATGSSAAVVVNEGTPLIHTAQFFPLRRKGGGVIAGGVVKQAEYVLDSLDKILEVAGSDLSLVVKLNVYLSAADSLPQVQKVLSREFNGNSKPAVSFVVGNLAISNALVAMDAVGGSSIAADDAKRFRARIQGFDGIDHAAVLPPGPQIYVSGMADTNALPDATRITMEKLTNALAHFGLEKKDVVQVKAFLQPMAQIESVREQIVKFFDGAAPPTVFVDWESVKPPIEIELIAAGKRDNEARADTVDFITPPGAPASKVYSRVARVNHGKLIYTSGLYGMKSADGAGQIREIFANLDQLMKQAGSDMKHLVKATYYVSDNETGNQLNAIRPEFYDPQRPPAASKIKLKEVGQPNKTITMDMIAVTK